jgi:ribosome biogenesis GTPase / thiamine phosphate phosphatase
LQIGRIIKSTGSWYNVATTNGDIIPCRLPGKLRLEDLRQTNPVAVGDKVDVEVKEDKAGIITRIHERQNYLTRQATHGRRGEQIIAANIDLGILVQSARQPQYKTGLIDRFLITCEANHVQPLILINKMDLSRQKDSDELVNLADMYRNLGYEIIFTSIGDSESIERFRTVIEGKTVTLMGPSGTGKSSLLNALKPDLNRATTEISGFSNKGKHTTTFAELLQVGNQTYVVDTPGIREFGLVDIDAAGLSNFYVEMRELRMQCRFYNCTHVHEPDCAVQKAWEGGEIHLSRYSSYLQIIESLAEK